jgi:DNA (cytosine-5)-methyltransferase 1
VGPLGADGRPLKSKKGEIFHAWTEAIRKCGYHLEHRILNAADFGGATTRQRFFLIARRGNRRVAWPEPTHSKNTKTGDLFLGLKPWRGAREIIDWSRKGASIFNRKKPLARNTLARIEAGLRKFGGAAAEPFIVALRGTAKNQLEASVRPVSEPLPTVVATGTHIGLAEPFLVGLEQTHSNGAQVRLLTDPIPSVTTAGRIGLVEAFILQQQSGGSPRSTKEPLPSIASKGAQAIVQPFILAPLGIGRGNAPRSVDQPMPTILATRGGGHLVEPFIVTPGGPDLPNGRSIDDPLPTVVCKDRMALVQPFIVPFFGERDGQPPRTHAIEEPLPTITGHGAGALVEPFITQVNHGTSAKHNNSGRVRSVRDPLSTITAERSHALVEPFLVKYNGTAKASPIDKPLPTVTSVERLGLVEPKANAAPQQVVIDILFRMLEPHELARAMGFEGYEFRGTKKDRVKMIGNAVSVELAKALIKTILGD